MKKVDAVLTGLLNFVANNVVTTIWLVVGIVFMFSALAVALDFDVVVLSGIGLFFLLLGFFIDVRQTITVIEDEDEAGDTVSRQ